MWLVTAAITNGWRYEPFKFIIANFGSTPIERLHIQAFENAAVIPESFNNGTSSTAKMLGLITYQSSDPSYLNSHINTRNVEKVNKHLAVQLESHVSFDAKLENADDITIGVPYYQEAYVCDMILKA